MGRRRAQTPDPRGRRLAGGTRRLPGQETRVQGIAQGQTDLIDVRTLTDGGQTPVEIAKRIADFLGGAKTTLDLALYDLRLGPETTALVVDALVAADRRGVSVRLAYNVDHDRPIPVPPPPRAEPTLIESLPVPTKGIPGVPDLMHHKYVVRDGAAVWTGSTNWTDDSWAREENVIVVVASPELAARFTRDFEQLWRTGIVEGTGEVEPNPLRVGGRRVRAWFTPGYGDALAHRVAKRIGRARRRVRIASPVITSGPIIATLAEVAADGRVDLAGAVDATQIADVVRQWSANQQSAWKIPLLGAALESAPFSGKHSTPWAPDNVHDYMHAKVTVADDVVFAGSYNLSHSGEQNAENMLELEDPALADRLAHYVDEVRARYPAVELS